MAFLRPSAPWGMRISPVNLGESNLDVGHNEVIPMRVDGQSIAAGTVLGNLFGTAQPAHAEAEVPGQHAAKTSGPAPALIFLSYASADRDRVRPLVSHLENRGFDVFWDRGIPPGQDPMEFLGSKLAECRCVLVAWTTTSVVSRYVRNEALHGYDGDKLLPIRLDDVVPRLGAVDT
jgi:TIR domain